MSEASLKYSQPTLWDLRSATSSQGSAAGQRHYDLLTGQLVNEYGPEVVHASHSHKEAIALVPVTQGIFGQSSTGSSKSADLCMSLGSKLQERLDSTGSMGYDQTWKLKATPLGLPYWEHTARLSHMSDSDFSGLPTPTVNSILERSCPVQAGRVRYLPSGRVRKSSKKGKEGSMNWSQDILLRGYLPTPKLCLFLMGFPIGWLLCGEQATQLFRKLQPSSSKHTSKSKQAECTT